MAYATLTTAAMKAGWDRLLRGCDRWAKPSSHLFRQAYLEFQVCITVVLAVVDSCSVSLPASATLLHATEWYQVRSSNGTYEFIDFRETAPAAAFEDMYSQNVNLSLYGGLAR